MTETHGFRTALQPFLLLAKNTKSRALCDLIKQALAAPEVFTFAELCDLPNVKEVRELQGRQCSFNSPVGTILRRQSCSFAENFFLWLL